MTFYDEMQNIATGLLTEFNQGSIALLKPGAKSGPAWSPVTGAEIAIPVQGVAVGVSKKYVDKGLAIATDKQVTCAIPSEMPEMDWWISIDGQRLKIQHIAKIPEAGTPVTLIIIAGTR